MSQLVNFFACEGDIVQRLKAVLGDEVKVLTAADMAGIKESSQPTPAAHVVFGGFRPVEDQGTAWRIAQTWYVVAAVRNVASLATGQPARAEAGVLVAQIMSALAGHKLPSAVKLLTLSPSQMNPRYAAGVQSFPMAFVAEIVFRKTT